MRILFYLPGVVPWWFETIVEPLIRRLAQSAEVHILAPVPWRETGIGITELRLCADLPQLHWHIVDGEGHQSMRTEPADRAGIVEFVRSLAPDYVLCRTADCETVRQFPGVVRHIMEAAAPPLTPPWGWIVLREEPFDHGCMPDLDADALRELDRLIAPIWEQLRPLAEPSEDKRAAFREWAGITRDRPILLLPLEFEHEENFYDIHRVGASPNHRLIAEVAEQIGDDFFLAITNHPLNELRCNNSAVVDEIASHGARMRLIPSKTPNGESTTTLLTREAAGVLMGDSKVFSMAGFFGTPMLRRSRFRTGQWLNTYSDFENFLPAVANGTAQRASNDDARRWFAFHIANNLLDPADPALTVADIVARMDRPVDPSRWDAGVERYRGAAEPRRFQ